MWRHENHIFSSLHLMVHETPGKSLQTFLMFQTRHPTYVINIAHSTLRNMLIIVLGYLHLTTLSLNFISQNQNSKMSQASVSTTSKRTKEKLNPRIVYTNSEVINDVVPLSIVHSHTTPIRNPRKTASKKVKLSKVSKYSSSSMSGQMAASDIRNFEPSTTVKKPRSMTSLYLDPINVEPNVDASAKSYNVPKVMRNVETYKNTDKLRFVTILSKYSVIVAERHNVDKDIRVDFSSLGY